MSFKTCAGKTRMLDAISKLRQASFLALMRTMYLLSATGCSTLLYCSLKNRSCNVLSVRNFQVATTSSAVTGVPSEKRAFGSIRNQNVILSGEIFQCVAKAGMYL